MTRDQITNRLRELGGELATLRQAEEQAAATLAESWIMVEELDRERWSGSGRGRLDLAVQEWRKAQRTYQVAAQKLEEHLREGGRLRRMLNQMEAAPRIVPNGIPASQDGSAE